MSMSDSWEDKVAAVRHHRDASLQKVSPPLALDALPSPLPLNSQGIPKLLLTPREIEITENYTVKQLLAKLRSRQISVEEVTRAFLRRAAVAQASVNCLTELLWDFAIERARYLDSLPEPQGALFGLPISTKEQHGMRGENVTTNASYVAWIDRKPGSNQIYDILWDAGCVFYARTTQPQTVMHLETNSNIYGRTLNPYNRDLTPGGSSGGESALIGIRGSILGVGGDIGGSIRLPAAHCGIYGFKPTCKRISAGVPGRESILSSYGPMTTDRDAMELFMQTLLAAKPWLVEPSLTFKQWIPYQFDRPLKIAVQWWDGVVKPHPPIIRALTEVAAACKAAGMEVVDWDCDGLQHDKAWEIISSLYWPDGGAEAMGRITGAGEPVLPLTKFIIEEQPSVKRLSIEELWERTEQRDAYRAFYARAWTATGQDGREVDVILGPASFGAATPHDQSRYWGYTSQWNLLDYPGAVFPVTTVDPAQDAKDETYVPKNEQDKFCYELYTPERYKDAPVSLQIIGRRNHDEKVLAALVEIEKALGRP
ncbi:hypothetical protein A1O3_07677 [Capronia epimyces CBS 606.96]|uniref:amidase n=1 Tax=Capronia epimyces CBS 606.96 TaxID=1182542 RepID=W9XWN8_9EURO|nr:uncharacterized protein A1O3_07677 [Capronia epimyces CBS 606.96]EXJ81386.1 hypothetical protein A1O3_07677 [Capronia epimyces CBS 606.96]